MSDSKPQASSTMEVDEPSVNLVRIINQEKDDEESVQL